MKELAEIELNYWNSYLNTLSPSEKPLERFVEASYAGSSEITDELLELYLCGKKTAGSSIVEDYLTVGDPLPKVGNYWIYLNSKNVPSCILKTVKVVTNKFSEVPLEIAIAEGEGDLSLEYWRDVHSRIYFPFLAEWGVSSINDATVLTEYFELVFQ